MYRRLTVSAVFVAGLFAVTTAAQPPAGVDKPPSDAKRPLGEKVKLADPADAAVAAAVANDTDGKSPERRCNSPRPNWRRQSTESF